MHRHALSDEQGSRLRTVLPNRRQGPKSKIGDREFINAVLYRAKTGVPWRDLPERFGPWKSFYNASPTGQTQACGSLSSRSFNSNTMRSASIIDGTVVRAHQDASGARGGSNAMLWAALEEVFHRSSPPLWIPKGGRSTLR